MFTAPKIAQPYQLPDSLVDWARKDLATISSGFCCVNSRWPKAYEDMASAYMAVVG